MEAQWNLPLEDLGSFTFSGFGFISSKKWSLA